MGESVALDRCFSSPPSAGQNGKAFGENDIVTTARGSSVLRRRKKGADVPDHRVAADTRSPRDRRDVTRLIVSAEINTSGRYVAEGPSIITARGDIPSTYPYGRVDKIKIKKRSERTRRRPNPETRSQSYGGAKTTRNALQSRVVNR